MVDIDQTKEKVKFSIDKLGQRTQKAIQLVATTVFGRSIERMLIVGQTRCQALNAKSLDSLIRLASFSNVLQGKRIKKQAQIWTNIHCQSMGNLMRFLLLENWNSLHNCGENFEPAIADSVGDIHKCQSSDRRLNLRFDKQLYKAASD